MNPHAAAISAGGRAARLQELLARDDLDQLYVGDLVNVRYLTGFTGTNGACLMSRDGAVFFTDFRYTERAAEEVGEGWEQPAAERELLPQVAKRMTGRVGFEDSKLSVRSHAKLAGLAEGVELVGAGDLVEEVRAIKEGWEIERIAAAAELADEIYRWAIGPGLIGRTEIEVAEGCIARMRDAGAVPSFPPIIAAGANGALPHAEPGDREIGRGALVVFDMGAELDGYCSDCTRTFATSEVEPEQAGVYELVRAAQEEALNAVVAGAPGKAVDAIARELITAGGHGEEFGHGLGHGVGIEIHEAPRLSTATTETLAEGMVVTVEPGVYVAGSFGVRIEDLVVVRDGRARNLSSLPKELTVTG